MEMLRDTSVRREGADMQEIELKPCPFCGGQAEYEEVHTDNGAVEIYYKEYHGYIIECNCCNAYIVSTIGKEDVIQRWNRRT